VEASQIELKNLKSIKSLQPPPLLGVTKTRLIMWASDGYIWWIAPFWTSLSTSSLRVPWSENPLGIVWHIGQESNRIWYPVIVVNTQGCWVSLLQFCRNRAVLPATGIARCWARRLVSSSSAWKDTCGEGNCLGISPIWLIDCEQTHWTGVGQVVSEGICLRGKFGPARTPTCWQGLVEKIISYYNPRLCGRTCRKAGNSWTS